MFILCQTLCKSLQQIYNLYFAEKIWVTFKNIPKVTLGMSVPVSFPPPYIETWALIQKNLANLSVHFHCDNLNPRHHIFPLRYCKSPVFL